MWCCALSLVAMSGPLGIMPPLWAWVAEWIVVGCLAVVSTGHALRLWPDRYIQLASHMQLWLPLMIPTIGLYATKQEVYASLFIVMIASAGALLHRKLTLATIGTVAILASVLLVRADGEFFGVYISAVWFAGIAAVTIHMTMSRAFLRVAEMRDVADQNAREASERLAELQRAQEERARLQEQLLHSQRMEAVGTLAAGIAHDMNNVLMSISSLASLLEDSDRRTMHEDVNLILMQTERGASLTRSLLAFSRRGQYRKRPIALWEVVRQLIPILQRTLPKSIAIRVELPDERVCVEADSTHLEQMLLNLALNARDAMGGAGTLSIVGDLARDGRARLRVGDTGTGMDEATRIRVFEPFFTTKPLGKGTGLGLSTVWGIVQAHGGEITVDSTPGAGATFTILLPASDAEPTPRIPLTRLPTAEPVIEVRGTVLVVDDEAAVRNTSMRLLERMGLDVITAENGLDALAKLHDGVQLVVLDMGMPVMGGAECFRRLRERSDVPVLIATGFASDEEAQAIVARGASLLEKPFTSARLKHEVSRLLARTPTVSRHAAQVAASGRSSEHRDPAADRRLDVR